MSTSHARRSAAAQESSQLKSHVRKYRLENELTQAELSSAVDVTRQTIISIEKGNYVPSVLLAMKIARRLGVRVEELFNYD